MTVPSRGSGLLARVRPRRCPSLRRELGEASTAPTDGGAARVGPSQGCRRALHASCSFWETRANNKFVGAPETRSAAFASRPAQGSSTQRHLQPFRSASQEKLHKASDTPASLGNRPTSPVVRQANVKLSNISRSATPTDIYRLSPLSRHITAVRFALGHKDLSRKGSVYLSFDPSTIRSCAPAYPLDEEGQQVWKEAIGERAAVLSRARKAAEQWIKDVDGSFLAGQMVKAEPHHLLVPKPHNSSLLSRLLQTESGKLVLLTGLPANLTALHLERVLKAQRQGGPTEVGGYDIKEGKVADVVGEVGPVWKECGVIKLVSDSPTAALRASFLVRLQNVPEASRLVNAWDGRVWEHKLGSVVASPRASLSIPRPQSTIRSGNGGYLMVDDPQKKASKLDWHRKETLQRQKRDEMERRFEAFLDAEKDELRDETSFSDLEVELQSTLQERDEEELQEDKGEGAQGGKRKRRHRKEHTRLQRMQHLLIRNTHVIRASILY